MSAWSYLNWLRREIFDDTPRRNFLKLRRWLRTWPGRGDANANSNKVLADIVDSPVLPDLVAHAVSDIDGLLIVLGPVSFTRPLLERLNKRSTPVEGRDFQWGFSFHELRFPSEAHVVLALTPATAVHWEQIAAMRQLLGSRLLVLTELLLPYARLSFLQRRLDYYLKELPEILPYYLGRKFFGPIDELDARFPLRGKSVIEFGPFDGCQTAGIVHFGASRLVCVEARAENATKTATAAEVFNWHQVRIVMDDFHNAHAARYGRFDLAFAHGVYYHSVAPFIFLGNLCTLSDAIFIGGFCATENLPASDWMELPFEGRSYRAKAYREISDFTAGVNPVAYFFHPDDLRRYFSERGYTITTISDESSSVTAGSFLRFLALRQPDQVQP